MEEDCSFEKKIILILASDASGKENGRPFNGGSLQNFRSPPKKDEI